MNEPTGFENKTLEEVVASFLYTSQNMFGEVVFDAERELFKRTPPPKWAIGKNGGLPTMAKEFYQESGEVK